MVLIPPARAVTAAGAGLIDGSTSNDFVIRATDSNARVFVGCGDCNAFPALTVARQRLGIGTGQPAVTLDIVASDALALPAGSNQDRPAENARPGMIRYNTQIESFEGLGASGNWTSLGGVIDLDRDTYILASNDNSLKFFVGGVERARIDSNALSVFEDGSNLLIATQQRLGIGTSMPAVTLDVVGTDALRIPVGCNAERPASPRLGMIRFNTDQSSFEGYGAGDAWQSLGGVSDINKDTYIAAQLAPGCNDDALRFFTAGQERLRIESNGLIGIGTTRPGTSLDIATADALGIPVGNTAARPDVPRIGYIRYNTELQTFEGFSAGNTWKPIGGLNDSSSGTFILSELAPGCNEGPLRFYTGGEERMRIEADGLIGIGTSAPAVSLDISATDAVALPAGSNSERPSSNARVGMVGTIPSSNLSRATARATPGSLWEGPSTSTRTLLYRPSWLRAATTMPLGFTRPGRSACGSSPTG